MPQPPSGGPGPGAHDPPGGSAARPPGEHGDGPGEPQEHQAGHEDASAPNSGREPAGPPLGAPPQPEPISTAPSQSRGCATAAIAALAVVVLALVGAGVWAIVALGSAPSGEYGAAPDCSVAPEEVLDALVPARETELNRRIENFDPELRDGYECRWATPQTAARVPAVARLALVRYADRTGTPGTEAASTALRAAAQDKDAHTISDVGDEAEAWNETLRGFDWGCVGVRMSNLYTMACHTAAVSYQADASIPGDVALSNAESLARAVADEIEQGDY
ncbi:hypothetical protein [Streptomonospora alba]|uniref:hypothetical protein n=1 Tax=Streptomonospora alba TaxID=183763 RepID=UPI00069B05D9|nr:hypothetical protein [Streptomonospora alba]